MFSFCVAAESVSLSADPHERLKPKPLASPNASPGNRLPTLEVEHPVLVTRYACFGSICDGGRGSLIGQERTAENFAESGHLRPVFDASDRVRPANHGEMR